MIKFLLSFLFTLVPTTNIVVSKLETGNLNINKKLTADIQTSNAMWGGLALSYFIYKHSDIEKQKNNYWDDLISSLNFEGNRNISSSKSKEVFKQNLVSFAVNISMYGMTSYREFFAEAHTKWISTPKVSRNISWEILDYFFRIILPKLINLYNGDILLEIDSEGKLIQNKYDLIKKIIDNDFNLGNSNYPVKSSSIIYETNIELSKITNKFNPSELGYSSEQFGFINTRIPNYYSTYIIKGTLAAFKQSIAVENSLKYINYGLDVTLGKDRWDTEDADLQLDNFWKDTFNKNAIIKSIDKYERLENYSYKKANPIVSDDFDKYTNSLKYKYYSNYKELSDLLFKATNKNVNLKLNTDALSEKKGSSDKLKNEMQNIILTTFNIDTDITTNGGTFNMVNNVPLYRYFLTNIVLADSKNISDSENTMAYTSISMLNQVINRNSYTTSLYGYIIFKGDSFDTDISQFQNSWWSSPNKFTTFPHEMGHLLDGFMGMYGSSKNISNNPKLSAKYYLYKNHDKLLDYSKTSNIYKGKLFYNNSLWEKIKNLHLLIPISISVVIISATIFYFIKRKKKNN